MACEALAALPLELASPEDVTELFGTGSLAAVDVAFVESAVLMQAAEALRRAAKGMDNAGADGRRLTQQLSEAGIDARSVVVVLYRVIGAAGRGATTDEQVQAIAAASCYTLLVRCVGEAFQPMVLRRALNALRVRAGGAGGTKRKAGGSRAAPAKRGATPGDGDGRDGDSDTSQTEPEDPAREAADPEAVAQHRAAAVQDVCTLVSPGAFSLSGYSDALANLVEVMADLVAASVGVQSGQKPSDAAPFHVLNAVLGQQHGTPADTMKVVFHALLPVLLGSSSRSSGATISRTAIRCRDGAFEFISALMSDPGGTGQNHPVHLIALCQHMCMKVSDRAEYRRSACQTVVKLLLLLPAEHLSHFIRFLSKYSKNEKALYRHFSCDLSLEIVTAAQEVTLDTTTAFNILKARATDKAPTVRAKALIQLSACLMGPRATDLLRNGAAVDSLLALARIRSRDAKPAVRKAGLHLLCAVLRRCIAGADDEHPVTQFDMIDPADIHIIAERCRDSALTTRKAALQMLTDLLLAAPRSETVQETWLKTILPTVLDQQASAVDGCCSLVYDVLLAPLVSSAAAAPSDLAWSLLERIRNPDSLQCLHKIIKLLHAMPKFTDKIGGAHVTAAQAQLDKSGNTVGPWVLLEEISHVCATGIDAEQTWKTWHELHSQLPSLPESEPDHIIAVHALRVFSNCQLHGSRAASAGKALVSVVKKLLHTPQVTKAVLDCMSSMAKLSTGSEKACVAKMLEWCTSIMSDCDAVLYNYMFGADAEADTDQTESQRVVITLFISGEVSLVCPKAVPKRVVSVLQSLVNPADNADAGHGVRTSVPESVRAHAIVALGKICLDDQSLAKKCVAAFSRELMDKNDAPVIRNNIIFILSDLCRRFTSLVDPHLPLLSRCLGDPLPIVRKQTMLLLAGLLQEDYLKWKGPLFYRFLIMTIDTDVEIAAQARFIMFTLFHKVDGKLLSNHFVEALFYLNDFTGHESYNQFSQSDADRSLFCLPGKEMQQKRMRIYTAMLAPLPDDQKLNITARLCHDVLARATNTDKASAILDLDHENACEVLHDAMVLLASKDIKLAASARKSADIDEDIEADSQPSTAAAFTSAATAKVLSQVAKKGSVEQTLPILVEVRSLLVQRKSPLLRALMTAVRETIKDYQDDIKHILTDRQLAAEIMYDLEQMKVEAEREARAAQSPRAVAASPRSSAGSARRSMRGSARLSMATPARPTSLKDTFTPALSARRSSGSAARTTPFSVPRLRPSASPSISVRRSSEPRQATFAVPLPRDRTPREPSARADSLASPIPSSLPLRVVNKRQPGDSAQSDVPRSAGKVDILMPSPFKPLPEPRLSGAEKAAPSDVEQPTDDENSGEGNAKRLSGTSHGAGGSVRKATKT